MHFSVPPNMVGTGTGVSGLWLLRGMRSDGVLTTVDIETEHQRDALRALGCTYGQGFLFARPLDVDAAGAFLENWSKPPAPVEATVAAERAVAPARAAR